jgi:hypothetical protein
MGIQLQLLKSYAKQPYERLFDPINLAINKEFFSNEPPLIHGEHYVKEEINIVIVVYVRLVQIIRF